MSNNSNDANIYSKSTLSCFIDAGGLVRLTERPSMFPDDSHHSVEKINSRLILNIVHEVEKCLLRCSFNLRDFYVLARSCASRAI